jgi:hypothetical protein
MTTRLHAQIPRTLRVALIVVSLLGLVAAMLTFWLGFEEPNSLLLWASVLTLATPIGVLVHLSMTRALTDESKRVWWKAFASAQMWSALSEYLSSPDLAASADRIAVEAQARRGLGRT